MLTIGCKVLTVKETIVSRFREFLRKEKGGAEIIGVVLVIAVVLVLGGLFWNNIKVFFEGLWASVVGKNPVDGMTTE